MAYGRAYGRFGARARLTRYPSRRASAALTSGRYATYRSMRGFRKTGFRGRFPTSRRTVAGNRAGTKRVGARTDFPAYVPRTVSLRQEQKYIEFAPAFQSTAPWIRLGLSTTSPFVLLPLPTRMDALNGRLSDRILYNSLIIRGRIQAPQYTFLGDTPLYNVEMFIVWDNAPTGALPAFSTVFTVQAGAPSTSSVVGLLQRPDSRDRFSLLYRYRYQLQGNLPHSTSSESSGSLGGDRVCIPIDLNLSINKVTAFTNTSGTAEIADIRRGAPYLFLISDTTSATDCNPVFEGFIRGLFADL